MVEFESVFQTEEDEVQAQLNAVKKQLEQSTQINMSSEAVRALKRLTRKTYIGTGANGDATFDGSSAVTGFSRSGTTYTATSDRNLDNVTVAKGVTVLGRQYYIFIKGNLSNQGTILANGGWW
jgi:hypothetical protein